MVPRMFSVYFQIPESGYHVQELYLQRKVVTEVIRENVPSDFAFIAMKVVQNWEGTKLHLPNQVRVIHIDNLILCSPHIHGADLPPFLDFMVDSNLF
jgi:hypothetical protein